MDVESLDHKAEDSVGLPFPSCDLRDFCTCFQIYLYIMPYSPLAGCPVPNHTKTGALARQCVLHWRGERCVMPVPQAKACSDSVELNFSSDIYCSWLKRNKLVCLASSRS